MKVTLPEEFVIVDLEGFYQFPWGRGKMGSKSEKCKQSAESLQEFFPGTDLKRLKLPEESTPAPGAKQLEPLVENIDHGDEESDSVNDSRMDVDGKGPADSEAKVVDSENADSGKELRMDVDAEKPNDSVEVVGVRLEKSSSAADTENVKSHEKEDPTSDSKLSSNVTNKDSNAQKEKTVSESLNVDAQNVKESAAGTEVVESDNTNIKDSDDEKDKAIENKDKSKAVTEKAKSANEPESELHIKSKPDNTGVGKTKETDNSSETPKVQYDVVKHGSSELLLPKYELFFKQISQQQSTIASRTLLSLRRSDEEALDEIRIFNAQDNFVVNSCAIRVNLKEEKNGANGKGALNSNSEKGLESVGSQAVLESASSNSETVNKVTSDHTDHEALEKESASVSSEIVDKAQEDSEATILDPDSVHAGINDQGTGKKRKEYMNKKDVYWRTRKEARVQEDDERERILGSLFLRGEKIQEVWNNQQLILPFQVGPISALTQKDLFIGLSHLYWRILSPIWILKDASL